MIEIEVPGSKSVAARALVCRLLSGHDTRMDNLPDCGDTRGMLRLTEAVREALRSGLPTKVEIGEGGTTLRFGMAACASIRGLDITLKVAPRLMERPHDTLINALIALGADIETDREKCEFHIIGKELQGGDIILDGSVSSQYVSALMMAAPVWLSETHIHLEAPVVSVPYIRMTAGVMRRFGAFVDVDGKEDGSLDIKIKAAGYAECARMQVEGDWSGASYFFEVKLIAKALGIELPRFTMPSLSAPAESLQGDSRVAEIFANAKPETVLDLSDAPDLVPAIAVGFCIAGYPFRIEGVAHLRHKETDRMEAIYTELKRLGYVLECGDETMEWKGVKCEPEPSPRIRTYGDHRMAMAFAPARMAFPALTIENPSVVDKSFPTFWTELHKIMPSVWKANIL